MAAKSPKPADPEINFARVGAVVKATPLQDEIQKSFLAYSYMVIGSRAIADSRDGLKPVHRRVLWSMFNDGNTPEKTHTKSAKIVGAVIGNYHPFGDSACYEAMARLAQNFSLMVPLVDPRGNFGAPGSSPAAARYTEARLSKEAMLMLQDIKEDSVPFIPNYDSTRQEPTVLPTRFINTLINGGSGIAVGMATNMAPHNPTEAMEAVKYVIKNPSATLKEVMKRMPAPDFPTGGEIIGLDKIKEAYETGRGIFRIRGKYRIEQGTRGKHSIIFYELPFETDPESIIAQVQAGIKKQEKFAGLFDVKDLTDRINGTRLVFETKAGVNPDTVVSELLAYTNLEKSFGINNIVISENVPKTVGVLELIREFIDFRKEVVVRRSEHRRQKRQERLHIVEGLLKALINIDEVIKIVRASETAQNASAALQKKFQLDEIQAGYVLDIPLRRLTKLDKIELEAEKEQLLAEIKELTDILDSPDRLTEVIYEETHEAQKIISRPRRSLIVGGTLAEHVEAVKETVASVALGADVADEPCYIYLTPRYGVVRSSVPRKQPARSVVVGSTRGRFVAVTSKGRGFRIDSVLVGEKEAKVDTILPDRLGRGETVVAIVPESLEAGKVGGIALGTRKGVVKVVSPQWPVRSDDFVVVALDGDDEIVGAGWVADSSAYDFVFITDRAALLTFPADKVRPQGLTGGGMAGIKLADGGSVVGFNIVEKATQEQYILVSATDQSIRAVKFSPELFPQKGRGTGGYSVHSFLKGEEKLALAGVTLDGVLFSAGGKVVPLPALSDKRTSSGTKFDNSLF